MMVMVILLELTILLVGACVIHWRRNRSPEYTLPPRSTSPTQSPQMTKSQRNTRDLLRWQHIFDLMEAQSNGTSRSR